MLCVHDMAVSSAQELHERDIFSVDDAGTDPLAGPKRELRATREHEPHACGPSRATCGGAATLSGPIQPGAWVGMSSVPTASVPSPRVVEAGRVAMCLGRAEDEKSSRSPRIDTPPSSIRLSLLCLARKAAIETGGSMESIHRAGPTRPGSDETANHTVSRKYITQLCKGGSSAF